MKTSIAIITLCVAFTGRITAQTNQVVVSKTNAPLVIVKPINPMDIELPDPLVTLSGKTYNAPKLNNFYPATKEIIISYDDDQFNLENLKITDLPPDLQIKFGYEPKTNTFAAGIIHSDKNLSDEERIYYANSLMERQQDEAAKAAAQAAAEEQARQDALREREVAAKEAEANKPPVQVNQQQNTFIW